MSSEQAGGTPGSGAVSDRMRALLARAAEEQLLEQRQVSAVLGELRTLVEDVDERLATGEQVERVAAEVRALSARVEARLDAAEARSAELADRISEATALVGRAAQDLLDAVATGVAQHVQAQLDELSARTAATVADAVGSSERRLATHVDDAVLALAEVVLRRRRPVAAPEPPQPQAVDDPPDAAPEQDAPPVEPEVPGPPPDVAAASTPEAGAEDVPDGRAEGTGDDPARAERPDDEGPPATAAAVETAEPSALDPSDPAPRDGFVLVPADVEQPDAGPAPPVPHERRTADRRVAERGDGSGRRRRPWWRPV